MDGGDRGGGVDGGDGKGGRRWVVEMGMGGGGWWGWEGGEKVGGRDGDGGGGSWVTGCELFVEEVLGEGFVS